MARLSISLLPDLIALRRNAPPQAGGLTDNIDDDDARQSRMRCQPRLKFHRHTLHSRQQCGSTAASSSLSSSLSWSAVARLSFVKVQAPRQECGHCTGLAAPAWERRHPCRREPCSHHAAQLKRSQTRVSTFLRRRSTVSHAAQIVSRISRGHLPRHEPGQRHGEHLRDRCGPAGFHLNPGGRRQRHRLFADGVRLRAFEAGARQTAKAGAAVIGISVEQSRTVSGGFRASPGLVAGGPVAGRARDPAGRRGRSGTIRGIEAKAERILREELKRLRWSEGQLPKRLKQVPFTITTRQYWVRMNGQPWPKAGT